MALYNVRAIAKCCICLNGVLYDAEREHSFTLTDKELELIKDNLEIISSVPFRSAENDIKPKENADKNTFDYGLNISAPEISDIECKTKERIHSEQTKEVKRGRPATKR